MRAPIGRRAGAALATAVVVAACGVSVAGRQPRSARSLETAPAIEITAMAYNVLFQYQQVPNADGSFPAWVCESYPYVVDHPELRWEHRFPAITATIERESPDVLGLNEMRGGRPAAHQRGGVEPAQDPRHGPPMIHDVTRWLRDGTPAYDWISVFDLAPASIEQDPDAAARWPGDACRWDMSEDGCATYDPRADHYSTKNFLAFRADRFVVLEAGAVELPTSIVRERRFAPWARLRERAAGVDVVVIVAHLDPHSGAHRIAGARRILELVARHAGERVVVLGDLNAPPERADDAECRCSCPRGASCACPDALLASCAGETTYALLTSSALVDTIRAIHGDAPQSSTLAFRVPPGAGWRSPEPCWPIDQPGAGRAHLPPITIERRDVRIDYVLTSSDVEVLDARVVSPVALSLEVGGDARVVHASDHLPVAAALRFRRGSR